MSGREWREQRSRNSEYNNRDNRYYRNNNSRNNNNRYYKPKNFKPKSQNQSKWMKKSDLKSQNTVKKDNPIEEKFEPVISGGDIMDQFMKIGKKLTNKREIKRM